MKKSERAVAVSTLIEVLENGAYANIALRKAFVDSYQNELDSRGRAFVTELVNETLRNLLRIDYVIASFSLTPLEKMKPLIRNLLRISVCQLRHMNKIPARAAVNEAVVLAKAYGFSNLSGFVNGVLRSIAREPEKPTFSFDFQTQPVNYLHLQYSYPKWMAESLIKWLGKDKALDFCESSHQIPSVTVLPNVIKNTLNELAENLKIEGVECTIGDGFLTLKNTADITKLSSFKDGRFFVIDPGAIFAVKALNPKPGQTIIDLCAAPGGKALAAAGLMGNKGKLYAFDIHPHRVDLISTAAKRLGLNCIQPKVKDILNDEPHFYGMADAVLLDAPCSGLGTIRKRPDIKFTRQLSDINTLAEKQRDMLDRASNYVKPGGILVYCTCTVAKEENIKNIRWFLQHYPFAIRPLENLPPFPYYIEENCLQILPSSENDGFFVAALVRN